jgi:L-seryl-tRNA(Ser) seleniumtransferase
MSNRGGESQPDLRQQIPSVDRVMRELGEQPDLPRPVVVAVVRRELSAIRGSQDNHGATAPIDRIRAALEDLRRSKLQPVINATGIIIHTNFARSPLAQAALDSLNAAAGNYTNLELDLTTGQRGHRAAYVEQTLALLCGADAATVVNNCAAALVLILRHFAARPPRNEVVISRGELVQIGGGFRIPEILEASGATLREIGTTNRTTIDDFRQAISGDRTALVLRVHRSNFYMDGFVESPAVREIAELAHRAKVPFVEDLGSGATFATETLRDGSGGEHEPTPAEALATGADLICFSGDKLLGGPQAGVIAGRAAMVAALKRDPFFRAVRCDKLILCALEATVDLLLAERIEQVPIRAMMQDSIEMLRPRAQRIAAAISSIPLRSTIVESQAQVGGGSLPRTSIPSVAIELEPPDSLSVATLAERLRIGRPPVIGHIADGKLRLDLRTIFPRQDDELIAAIRQSMPPQSSPAYGSAIVHPRHSGSRGPR